MASALPQLELDGPQDFAFIQQLLEQTMEQHLEEVGQETPEELRQALQTLNSNVINTLRREVAVRGEHKAPPPTPTTALKSPLLRPLSPPPVDDEVRALERQLDEASQRVAALRASMQARLAERLAEQLAAARPAARDARDDEEGSGTAGAASSHGIAQPDPAQPGGNHAQQLEADPADHTAPLSPGLDELRAKLTEAASKMPTLRARLEEASGRLQRVMGVAEGVLDGPPPNTVEKAVLSKTPGKFSRPHAGPRPVPDSSQLAEAASS